MVLRASVIGFLSHTGSFSVVIDDLLVQKSGLGPFLTCISFSVLLSQNCLLSCRCFSNVLCFD